MPRGPRVWPSSSALRPRPRQCATNANSERAADFIGALSLACAERPQGIPFRLRSALASAKAPRKDRTSSRPHLVTCASTHEHGDTMTADAQTTAGSQSAGESSAAGAAATTTTADPQQIALGVAAFLAFLGLYYTVRMLARLRTQRQCNQEAEALRRTPRAFTPEE